MRQKAAFLTALERRITVRLDQRTWAALLGHAEKEGVAASAFVRDLVEEFVAAQKRKRPSLRRVK